MIKEKSQYIKNLSFVQRKKKKIFNDQTKDNLDEVL